MERWEGRLAPTPPFSLALTAGYQTYFQGQVGADRFQNGVYSRLLVRNGRPVLLQVAGSSSPEDPNHPLLRIQVVAPTLAQEDIAWAVERASWILHTDADLRPLYTRLQEDHTLRPLLPALYGLHPPRMPSVFEGLVFAICGQQVSSVVARRIRTALVERFGEPMDWDGQVWRAFPSPERLWETGVKGLREVGLSQRKAEYILDIARQAVEGSLPLEALAYSPSPEVEARLTPLRGIGRWTVEWVLLRGLGRPEVFPAGDLALQRLLARLYNHGSPLSAEEARMLAERWGPWKGYVAVLLFAGARLGLFPSLR
ncbi:DNA-3-methyladenine glycosylase [bacterium HR23]|nr:DNA-3-methyladenine glycosylase [bacterium HR23]